MSKPLFNRKEATGLAKRFVKPEQYDPKRDVMVMYMLFKKFPSRDFWFHLDLGFQLNSAFWFTGADGQKKLQTLWELFHLDMKPQTEYKLEDQKQGQDFEVTQKPKTIADLLK